MARTPQSFEKRKRERDKQRKREEKLWRRLIRNEEKKRAKAIAEGRPYVSRWDENSEDQAYDE